MTPDLRIPEYDDAARAGAYAKRPGTTRAELSALSRLAKGLPGGLSVLDVPCGNGRLAPTLRTLGPDVLLGADGAPAMLERARDGYDAALAADASRLPLADRSVDLIVCVRLLHHFPRSGDRVAVLRELARVARRRVVVSFYRLTTLEGLRRRIRRKPSARVGVSLGRFRAELREAGLAPIRVASLLPLVREQTFFLAKPRDRTPLAPCDSGGVR
ncbi:MAG: class I SAM-dependent methyltransferase [Planctomycetota bacterium]